MKIAQLISITLACLASAGALAASPAVAPAAAPKVVCISPGSPRSACEGALKILDQAAFAKRFPGHAIMVSAISFRTKSAQLGATTGTLYIGQVVNDGKNAGLKPVWTFTNSSDTNNLSDGFEESVAASVTGFSLAMQVNNALRDGTFDKN